MELDEETLKFNQIFMPGLIESSSDIIINNRKFAYYTSSETAVKIISNGELWFRNTTVMNDFSEISYGLKTIRSVLNEKEGKRFAESVDDIFPETMNLAYNLFSNWENDWRYETYLACVSMHDQKEDKMGRLSMWRAYGNTALIINNTPMTSITDKLAVYSLPVLYISKDGMEEYISKITDSILINRKYLTGLGQATLVTYIHNMFFRFAIATKHPGFEEEKEWRLYYRPKDNVSPAMTEEVTVLNGVPQKVYKLKLEHDPEKGLYGADIPSLLHRVIIGPTQFPYVSYKAFVDLLEKAKVNDASDKVVFSDIPLRIG